MKSKRCFLHNKNDYATWVKTNQWYETNRRFVERKKEMTTVRFAYYLNSESHYESLVEYKYEEWSGFMRSVKVKQRQRITGALEL